MKATMGMYDIRRGDRLIYVSGPYDDRAPHLFRNAGGWWEAATGEWNFYVEDERAVAKAILEVYGEIPEWMERDYFNGGTAAHGECNDDPTVSIALGVVGATIALGFLIGLL